MTISAKVYCSEQQVSAMLENTNEISVADCYDEMVEKLLTHLNCISANTYKVVNETYQHNHTKLEFAV